MIRPGGAPRSWSALMAHELEAAVRRGRAVLDELREDEDGPVPGCDCEDCEDERAGGEAS